MTTEDIENVKQLLDSYFKDGVLVEKQEDGSVLIDKLFIIKEYGNDFDVTFLTHEPPCADDGSEGGIIKMHLATEHTILDACKCIIDEHVYSILGLAWDKIQAGK